MIVKQMKVAFLMLLSFSILTGLLYPLAMTGLAQVLFPRQANGSLIVRDGKAAGSSLIGQSFSDPRYFWGRLSATNPPYNAAASSGSNYGPLNSALREAAQARISALREADPANRDSVPVDLVTASASGLDPHISPAAAMYQAGRVARLNGLTLDQVQAMIDRHTTGRFLGLLGEPVVNVLELNLELIRR